MSSVIVTVRRSRRSRGSRRCGFCRQIGHDRRTCQSYKVFVQEQERRIEQMRQLTQDVPGLSETERADQAEETNEVVINSIDFSSIAEHIFINDEFPENLEGTRYTARQMWLIHDAITSIIGTGYECETTLEALGAVGAPTPDIFERDSQTYGRYQDFIVRDKKIQGVEDSYCPQETRDEDDTVSIMSEIPDPITEEDLVEEVPNPLSMHEDIALGIYCHGIPEQHRNQVITADDAWRIRQALSDLMMCEMEDTVSPMLELGFPSPTDEEFVEAHTTGPETYGGERDFFINQDGRVADHATEPIAPPQSPRPVETSPAPGSFDALPATTQERDIPSREEVRGSRASQNAVDSCLQVIERILPETLREFRIHLTPGQQIEGLRNIIGEAIARYTVVNEDGNRHLVMNSVVLDYIQNRMVEEYTAQITNTSYEVKSREATVIEFDEFKACNCEETACPICMEEFEDNKNQMILPCGHRFHTMCMIKNLCSSYNPTACPMCRTKFIDTPN